MQGSRFINNKSKQTVVMIPGGPGLGFASYLKLSETLSDFNSLLIDSPAKAPRNFDDYLSTIKNELRNINEEIILLGHSYGGFVAAYLFAKEPEKYSGIVLINAPLSKMAFQSINEQYTKFAPISAKKSGEDFYKKPSDIGLRDWMLQCGELYFLKDKMNDAKAMMTQDKISANTFLAIRSADSDAPHIVDQLKPIKKVKLTISGKDDLLVLPEIQKKQAIQMDFIYVTVTGSHFCHFEYPDEVASLIQRNFKPKEAP